MLVQRCVKLTLVIFLLSNSELNLLCKLVHISFFEKDKVSIKANIRVRSRIEFQAFKHSILYSYTNIISRRLQLISDLKLTSNFLTEKQKICVCRFLFIYLYIIRSKKVHIVCILVRTASFPRF